jgi:CRP-like cAMP-binding protein
MAKLASRANGFGNDLLDQLPAKERDRVHPHLRLLALSRGQTIYHGGDPVKYAYFPKGCLISLVGITEKAQSLEVGVIGLKGMLGLPAILRTTKMPYRALVQIAGDAWQIRADLLRSEFDQGQKLHDVLLRYCHTLITQVAQSAICHRFHKIEARLSRWLLDSHYHTKKEQLQLTHEMIAMMLGTSRSLITATAVKLQQTGAISYRQGRVTILDLGRLEAVACECHKIVKRDFAESLGL